MMNTSYILIILSSDTFYSVFLAWKYLTKNVKLSFVKSVKI